MARIEHWSVVPRDGGHSLSGQLFNDPRYPDGSTVLTSNICAVQKDTSCPDGKKVYTVSTKSGSVYELGVAWGPQDWEKVLQAMEVKP